MAQSKCNLCSAAVPAKAKFCPRCGSDVTADTGAARTVPAGPRVHPSTAPMPLAGILFLAAAILGPTMIAIGVSTGSILLLLTGIAVAIVLIVLLLLGMIF